MDWLVIFDWLINYGLTDFLWIDWIDIKTWYVYIYCIRDENSIKL